MNRAAYSSLVVWTARIKHEIKNRVRGGREGGREGRREKVYLVSQVIQCLTFSLDNLERHFAALTLDQYYNLHPLKLNNKNIYYYHYYYYHYCRVYLSLELL